MFDFDAGKLLIIGVVALIVIGPKDLPRVLRQVGQAVGRLRRMASEFQGQFMDAMKEADLQDIREEVSKLKSHADLSTHFDPARDIQRELTQAVSAVETPSPGKTFKLPEPAPPAGPAVLEPAAAEPLPPAALLDPEPDAAAATKRRIVLRRRAAGPSAGSELRAPAQSRYRNVRPRRQEADR